MKIEDKFKTWRNGLSFKARKNIKLGIDVFIVLLFFTTCVTVYDIGKLNGRSEFCAEQGGILVESQGITECWPIDQYEAYMSQWDTNKELEDRIKNELQHKLN